jgi:hypothetical protein
MNPRLARGVVGGAVAAVMSAMPACANDVPTLALPALEVAETSDGLRVSGTVVGLASGTVDADLTVTRRDASGTAVSRQAQSVDVTRGSRHVVATIVLSASEGTDLDVKLVLSAGEHVFARTETHVTPIP